MPDLHFDVITDTLSRLPVKSLLRFRCVSKHWCTLIDGPYFIKLHLKRSIHTKTNLSLFLIDCRSIHWVDLDTLNAVTDLDNRLSGDHLVTVWGFCNGLLCLSNNVPLGLYEEFILWNPSTRTHHTLPFTPIAFPEYSTVDWALCLGFGYDHVNDDYKVVRIFQFFDKDKVYHDGEVKVYSLKTNSWKRIQDCPYRFKGIPRCGLLSNGALHWVACTSGLSKSYPNRDNFNSIVAFDLGVEEYRIVPLPPDFSDNVYSKVHVNVLGGCLCLIHDCDFRACIDVWVMKDYGLKESWTKLFSIEQYGGCFVFLKSSDEILLSHGGKELILYDVKKGAKKVRGLRRTNVIWDRFDAGICVGSLVRPNGR